MKSLNYFFPLIQGSFKLTPRITPLITVIIVGNYYIVFTLLSHAAREIRIYFLEETAIDEHLIYLKLSLSSVMNQISNSLSTMIVSFTVIVFDLIYLTLPLMLRDYNYDDKKGENKVLALQCVTTFYDIVYFRVLISLIYQVGAAAIFRNFHNLNFEFFGSLIGFIMHSTTLGLYHKNIKIDILIKKEKYAKDYPYNFLTSSFDMCFYQVIVFTKIALAITEDQRYEMRLFFYILAMVLVFSFTGNFYYSGFTSETQVVSFTNYFLSLLHVFGLTFTFGSIMLQIGFHFKEVYYSILNIVALFLLTLLIIYKLNKYHKKKLYESSNILIQMISLITSGKSSIIELYLQHRQNCEINTKETKTCSFCDYISSKTQDNETTVEHYENPDRKLLIKLLFDYYQRTKMLSTEKLDDEEDFLYVFVETYIKYNQYKNNNFLGNNFYILKPQELSSKHPYIAMNGMIGYKDSICHSDRNKNSSLVSITKEIISKEHLSCNITKLLSAYYDLLTCKEMRPSYFIENAETISKIRHKTKKMLKMSKESKQDYMIIIMKYIYEALFEKKDRKYNNFNIDNYIDFMTQHFIDDNFFLVNYKSRKDEFEIIRSGKKFIKYLNSSLFNIFPFKKIVKEEFLDIINKNKTILEMPIISNSNEGTISTCKMYFKMLPNLNMEDSFMYCICQNNYSNAIVTRYEVQEEREYIVNYTNNGLKEKMFVPPAGLKEFYKRNQKIDFNSIATTPGDCDRKGVMKIKLNYNMFLKQAQTLLHSVLNKEGYNNQDMISTLNTVKTNIQTARTDETILLTNKQSIDKHNKLFYHNIYYIQKDCGTSTLTNGQENSKDIFFNLEKHTQDATQEITNNYALNSNSSMTKINSVSSLSKTIQSINDPEIIRMLEEERKTKIKQNKNFSYFSIFIFVFNITIILYTCLFLYFEVKYNNDFKNTFKLFTQFHLYLRLLMNSTGSLFYNICPALSKMDNCETLFSMYSTQLSTSLGLSNGFDINEFLYYEGKTKSNYLSGTFKNFKEMILETKNTELLDISETEVRYRFGVTTDPKNIKSDYQMISFFYAINLYHGLFFSLTSDTNQDTLINKIPINGINVNGDENEDIDLSNIVGSSDIEIQSKQITLYAGIGNFRILLNPVSKMAFKITQYLLSEVGQLRSVSIILTSILIAFHGFLLLACIGFSEVFKTLLNQHCIEIAVKGKSKILVTSGIQKITVGKKLGNFYEEDPMDLINKLNESQKNFSVRLKIKKDEMKAHEQHYMGTNTKANGNKAIDFPSNSYDSILRRSKIIATGSYTFTLLFTLIFLIIFIGVLGNYSKLVSYLNDNTSGDYRIYNLFSTLQVTIRLNQTQSDLYEYYYENSDQALEKHYSLAKVKETFDSLTSIQEKESGHQSLITPFKDQFYISCESIYQRFKTSDAIIRDTIASSYSDIEIEYDFEKICEHYHLLNYKDDKTIINDSIYRLGKLASSLVYTNQGLYDLSTSKEMFDLYLITLIIFRPIRNYGSSSVFVDYITEITNMFTILMYIYLVINIVGEAGLFLIVKTQVVVKYKELNKSGMMLSKSGKL